MSVQASRSSSQASAGARRRRKEFGAWLRARASTARMAWRRGNEVSAEAWHDDGRPRRRGGLGGYISGVSALYQRLRWDVALRRSALVAVGLLFLGLPLLLSVPAVLILLWTLSPR